MNATRSLALLVLTSLVGCRDSTTEPAAASGPASAAHSELAVSALTVASGDSVILTLTTKDAQGRTFARGGAAVVFRATGGLSTGSIGATIDRGNGTYTAAFRGIKSGAATTIEATIDGNAVTTPLPTIRVQPGAFSASTSTVSITPRTLLAGGRATIEIIARDAAGNAHETGGLRVSLTLGGGSAAGSLSAVTDHNNGRYSATFTAAAVGTPLTVSTTVNGTVISSPSPTVSVARGLSAEHSIITVSSDTVMVDNALRVTFEARDSAGVRRTSGGDTVRFVVLRDADGGDGSIDSVNDHDDGTYSATVTGRRDGLVRIGASINGRSKSTAIPVVTVLPIPVVPQKSSVTISADTVEAGQTAAFTVLLLDLNGSPVTGAAHRVRFTTGASGTSSGKFGETTDDGEGKYTAVFTGIRAGSAVSVGATIGDSTQIQMLDSLGNSHLPSITVRPGPASADSSLLVVEPSQINVGDSASIRLISRDVYGNSLARGGGRVAFSRAGGSGVSVGRISAVTDDNNGSYRAFYRADSAGTPDVISATLNGRALPFTASIAVGPACTPGPPSLAKSELTINDTTPAQRPVKNLTLQSGVTTTLIVRVKDAAGCSGGGGRKVAFIMSGGTSTGTLGNVVDLDDGRYAATFTGHKAGTSLSIVGSIDGQALTSEPVAVRVLPGDISTRTSVLTAAATHVLAGVPVQLTLLARDAAGNDVAQGGRVVTFVVLGTQPSGSTSLTTDDGSGTYRATYIGATAGSDTIVALIEGTKVAQSVTIAVEPVASQRSNR